MIECPICGAENRPEAESCQGCGFGLGFVRYTVLEVAPVAAARAVAVTGAPGDTINSGPPPETAVVPRETDSGEGPGNHRPGQVPGGEHPAGSDVGMLLENLRGQVSDDVRRDAIRKLGQLKASDPEIVRELLLAEASGPDPETRALAAGALAGWPHQLVLGRHPELLAAAKAQRRAEEKSQAEGEQAAEIRASPPAPPSLLGRLELPEWAAGGQRRRREAEPAAQVLAPARDLLESAQVAEEEPEAGSSQPLDVSEEPEEAGDEAPAEETWVAAGEEDAAEGTEHAAEEMREAELFQPLDLDLNRIAGTVSLALGLYLLAVRTVTGAVVLARGSSAPGVDAVMTGVLLEWSIGLGLAFMGRKKLQGRWDTPPPGLGWDISHPIDSLAAWPIFLLVWGFFRALPYLVIMVAPLYVVRDLVRFFAWLVG